MRYLSPASLFKDALPSSLDIKSIQLGRKKMLAELELSPDDTLDVNGTPFSKNDIIEYFDQLQQDGALGWHKAIAEDETLLSFLENTTLVPGQKFRENPLYNDPQFVSWLSPYFYTSFTAFADACFRTGNDNGLRTILDNPLLMTSQQKEQAWMSITKALGNNIAFLNYQRDRLKKNIAPRRMLDELSGIMGFNYINMIRMLPEDRFSAIRDNYAIAMVQTSIYVFNKFIRDRSWPVIWIENAGYLATSPATKSEIAVKLEEVNGIVARQSRNKKKNPVGAYFWVIIVVVRLFAWMISEATTSNNSYQYSPTNFTVSPSISTPATRDSLIKALLLRNHKDSTGAHPLQNNNVHPVPKH